VSSNTSKTLLLHVHLMVLVVPICGIFKLVCFIRFEALTATKINKILPGFQPRQVVKTT
jgi:hypothetical protein